MKNYLAIPLLWAALPVAFTAAQTTPAKTAPAVANTWTTRTYRFPSSDLERGFVSSEKGQLRAPALPKVGASPEMLLDFLKKSDLAAMQHLKGLGVVLPEGSAAGFDPSTKTLVIRTSGKGHEQVQAISRELLQKLPYNLKFTAHLIEADAAVVRGLLDESTGMGDHTPQLTKLTSLVAEGKARQVDMLRVESRSGQRALVQTGEERITGVEFSGAWDEIAAVTQEMDKVGSSLEIDPVAGPDGETIDLNMGLRTHYRAPSDRWESLGVTGRGVKADVRLTEFYTASIKSTQAIRKGTARIFGVWKPEGVTEPDRQNVLQVAIVRAEVPLFLRTSDGRIEQIFAAHGEAVRPTPAAAPSDAVDPTLPAGMIIRRYRVTPDALAAGASRERGANLGAAAAADPFSAATPSGEPRAMMRATSIDILRSQGIEFPKGSSANFNAGTGELIVRNTPENLAQLEQFLESLKETLPRNLAFTVQVVQADAAFLRKLEEEHSALCDHGAMWKAVLEAVGQGKAKIDQTLWIGGQSGQRVSTEVGREYTYVSEASGSPLGSTAPPSAGKSEAKSQGGNAQPAQAAAVAPASPAASNAVPSITAAVESRKVGTVFEIDPVVGADGETIDLNFSIKRDYVGPTQRAAETSGDSRVLRIDAPATHFHQTSTSTSISVIAGTTRLLAIWKPEGAPEFEKGDVVQAAFLTTHLESIGQLPEQR